MSIFDKPAKPPAPEIIKVVDNVEGALDILEASAAKGVQDLGKLMELAEAQRARFLFLQEEIARVRAKLEPLLPEATTLPKRED